MTSCPHPHAPARHKDLREQLGYSPHHTEAVPRSSCLFGLGGPHSTAATRAPSHAQVSPSLLGVSYNYSWSGRRARRPERIPLSHETLPRPRRAAPAPTCPAGAVDSGQQTGALVVRPVVQDPGQQVQVRLREGVFKEISCNTGRVPRAPPACPAHWTTPTPSTARSPAQPKLSEVSPAGDLPPPPEHKESQRRQERSERGPFSSIRSGNGFRRFPTSTDSTRPLATA